MKVQNNLTYIEIDGLNYPDFKDTKQPKEKLAYGDTAMQTICVSFTQQSITQCSAK